MPNTGCLIRECNGFQAPVNNSINSIPSNRSVVPGCGVDYLAACKRGVVRIITTPLWYDYRVNETGQK